MDTPQAGAGPEGGSRIVDNIVHFARVLRAAGLPVGPAAVIDAVEAVEVAGITRRDDLYWTLHAVFVKKREHRIVFHEAFETWWRARGLVEKMLAMLSPVAPPRMAEEKPKAGAARVAKALFQDKEPARTVEQPDLEIDARLTMSSREVLQTRDFAQMSAEEIARAMAEIRRLAMPADMVRTRRTESSARGRIIDARRSLRASLRSGGDFIPLKFATRRVVHPPLVALVDISGSMSQYSRLFLHFLHAMTEKRRHVHTFLFGTRLTNVTRQLTLKDPDEALIACSRTVVDWSGGTRIATNLATFNRLWSRRVLGQGAVVLLITDGLERDAADDLGAQMDRLHRSCRRLIWLNPLLRFDGFEAKATGIRTMLPHVDEFRPIHSLDAVGDLVAALSGEAGPRRDPRAWLRDAA
ncbi:vWA domain-containing protein [Methylobrevis pamukkalensis]|uniref:VWA domain containing CoxE-like protein n=1 Tax=Methylobrevis pamukkalensis TaxID=1439726 RepID=A0A1E3H2V7_9HYPH|nr:VWA domain-containing protein [Methylobrevis pamukkalensis]ODN70657.1 VWA domain containing CoxE-like protein [Methylobrevis pamukkalensis]